LEVALDEKRIDFSKKLGYIPSRSEVVRMAIEKFLDINRAEDQAAAQAAAPKVVGAKVAKRKG
jgi:Arc/MetJ-type ribon-helix-helix transcriptional regulator